ncbi:site-specific DNA-methyltransferase [Evansella sp. AB-P1]|uniref:site-specific DNA-methyltransferase n=1 Tax=Evansella sp. AB-P1 TaxID=3037653 RepID=UPI00241D0697|nr:site-specific DNA-methyltransferase [Evansella sp. AB-P1]MDG5785974.1 site-specific DNA-methyltransferase [Evansella sp. AB-P1]
MVTNTLYLGDALNVLERLDSESAALAFLDPPMHPIYTENFYAPKREEEKSIVAYSEYLSKVFQHTKRILKKDGLLFLYYIPNSPINFRLILEQVFERGFTPPLELTLNHQINLKPKGLLYDYDSILVYSKSGLFHLNEVTRPLNSEEMKPYRWKDKKGNYRLRPLMIHSVFQHGRFEWKGMTPPENKSWSFKKEKLDYFYKEGLIDSSTAVPMLKEYATETRAGTNWNDLTTRVPLNEMVSNNKKISVGQKPLSLMERIITFGSNEGDLILDPFAGFGTTLIAAEKFKRSWIGVDYLQDVMEVTEKRLKDDLGPTVSYTRIEESELIKSKEPISLTFKDIVVHTKEIAALQVQYKKLTDNLFRLKELLKMEGSTEEEIINRMEDWIINVNRFSERAPIEQLANAERELEAFFGRFWENGVLEKDTMKYLKTSEVIYNNMDHTIFDNELDFSPAVITLTKAIENEFYCKVYKPLVSYCSERFGHRKDDLKKWPKTLVVKNKFGLTQRTFTFGMIVHILFFNWDNKGDYMSIKAIVKEINLFKDNADIFDNSKRSVLENQFKSVLNHRNNIAHKDYIPVTDAKECREIILFEKELLLRLLEMLK